jgi:hypothetical protein
MMPQCVHSVVLACKGLPLNVRMHSPESLEFAQDAMRLTEYCCGTPKLTGLHDLSRSIATVESLNPSRS